MLDTIAPVPVSDSRVRMPPSAPESRSRHHDGGERSSNQADGWRCLAATLDEIDYGLILLDESGRLILVNHSARSEFAEGHPLHIVDGRLLARHAADATRFQEALRSAAMRGFRKLVHLGDGPRRTNVSIVPLSGPIDEGHATTLVILAKRQTCESLSVEAFALAHDLTPAETRILVLLCKGERPAAIASEVGVAISTVRTQIGSIRLKTGTGSIRALMQQVSVLPPLRCVLRGVNGGAAPSWPARTMGWWDA